MATEQTDKAAGKPPKITQEAPTAPPARDAQGNALDEYGLPLAGPLRVAELARRGCGDPREVDAHGLPIEEPWRGERLKALGRGDPETNPDDWS